MAALAVASWIVSNVASAQTLVIVEPPPPPPVIVLIEPPPSPTVVIVEAPSPAPSPSPSPAPSPAPSIHVRGLIDLTGDFLVLDGPALGGSVRGGVMFADGFTLQLALAYRGGLEHGSEANLGIELQRDFSPLDPMGFSLLGRFGTAFLLDDRADSFDAGIRLDGQVGIGGRFDVSSDVALITDLRAVLRFRPDDPRGTSSRDVDAGVLFSIGVRIRL